MKFLKFAHAFTYLVCSRSTLIFCEFELFSHLSYLVVHVTGVKNDALEGDETDENDHANGHIHVDL